jgi:hypothetical protein
MKIWNSEMVLAHCSENRNRKQPPHLPTSNKTTAELDHLEASTNVHPLRLRNRPLWGGRRDRVAQDLAAWGGAERRIALAQRAWRRV